MNIFANLKLRDRMLFIVLLSIVIPLLIIAVIIYKQLTTIEKNTEDDTRLLLKKQLHSFVSVETKHHAQRMNKYLEDISRKVQYLSLIGSNIIENPKFYANKSKWDVRTKIYRDPEGRYTSYKNDTVNVFLPRQAVLNEKVIELINGTAYLDDFFFIEYHNQEDIVAIWLALQEQRYARIYPNRMQSEKLPADYQLEEPDLATLAQLPKYPNVKVLWVPPYQDRTGEGQVVSCVSMIVSPDNRYRGTIAIDLSMKKILQNFVPYYKDKDIFSFLIDADTNIIAIEKKNKNYFAIPQTAAGIYSLATSSDNEIKSFARHLRNSDSGIENIMTDNSERIFSFYKVPETNWKLVVSASIDELRKEAAPIIGKIHNKFRIIKIIWIALFVFLLFLCMGGMVKLSSDIVQPISQVADAATQLEKGEIPHTLLVERKDEIARLVHSFNNLLKSLVQREQHVKGIQNYLESIIRNSPDTIIVADLQLNIVNFNKAAELLLGYKIDEAVDKNLASLFDDDRIIKELVEKAKKDTIIHGQEVVFISKNKTKIDVLISLSIVRNEVFNMDELILIAKDVREMKQREIEVMKRVKQLEMLHKTIFAALTAMDLDYLLQNMAKTIQETFLYNSVGIYAVDNNRKELYLKGKAGPYKHLLPDDAKQEFSEGILGLVARTGESYLCQDTLHDPYYIQKDIPNTKSELCVPIRSENDIVGVINVEEAQTNAFDAHDVLTIEAIAASLYTCIKNIDLYRHLKNRIDELTAFYEFSRTLMSTLDMDVLISRILNILRTTFNYSTASILKMDEKDNMLRLLANFGYATQSEQFDRHIGEGIIGLAAQEKKTIVIPDVNKEPRYIRLLPHVQSEIAIPLIYGEKLVGILDVESEHIDFFKQNEINMLTSLATQIAMAIDNASLFVQLQEAHKKLKESFIGILKALTAAIEAKDSYTDGHVQRTSYYAEKVARELKLNEELVESIKYASILHDIGKIGVPETILTKPGPLTDEERKLIQKHPEIGVTIIKDIEFLKEALPSILCHQERYNGETHEEFPGYPAGLKENDIPIGAHIIAVVDAYDAMTSDRPYRKAMSHEEAIAVLLREKGKQFHPKVVDAFLHILQK
ncbi:MAG: hypothetical protein A2Y62_08900 [Candidatus Fischerbacteria bacterium RBG_13_37_8]|uniref:Histidine kinase n=1 Tax=Candidatus Fischerbacteria bacterium RBG_13_37_8 TaxID=1817863 RepID=A0A1F5VVN8_9BACT|nr:MAG: hypothetical protein A2Y62_08900 [Candidatus Fischerbacteria bacterium RBG_13_37_8]